MNDIARHKLCELIASHGVKLWETPVMCRILLQQQCPECVEEVQLLQSAIPFHIPGHLLTLTGGQLWEKASAPLVERLQNSTIRMAIK